MDPESWDWSSTEKGEPVPNPGAVLQVRFEREEFRALVSLAREEGIGPVEFLRRIALDRIAAASRHERAELNHRARSTAHASSILTPLVPLAPSAATSSSRRAAERARPGIADRRPLGGEPYVARPSAVCNAGSSPAVAKMPIVAVAMQPEPVIRPGAASRC